MTSYDLPVNQAEAELAAARAALKANPRDLAAPGRVERAERVLNNAKRQRDYMLQVDRERAGKSGTRAAEKLAQVTEELRAAYMRQPGATEAGFRAALPDLLEARRRDEALHGHERELARARATGRYRI